MSIFQEIANKLTGSKDGASPLGPISQGSEQSPDEIKLAKYVKEKIDQVRMTNSRIAMEGVYLTNVAYLLGFDGVYYDTTNRQFKNVDPKRKLSRNRFKINKILPTIQNRLARITQSPPKYDVRPNSNSTEDKDSARLSLDVLNDVFETQNFEEKRQDLHMATMQGGVAYAQCVWDSMLGKPMINPETGGFDGYEGDVRIEILNCLEVFPDPLAKNLDDAQWWIKAKVRKLDYFRDRYERGSAVKEEDAWLMSSLYDLKSNALTSVGVAGANTQEQMKNSAIELVYHEKRCKEYPNGRKVVIASGIVLEDKELPIGEYDLVKFDDILIGGRYNSEAIITHLRPVQDQYNVLRTKCADWIRKMLAGKYVGWKGSGLGQEAMNSESGEFLMLDPVPNAPNGGAPTPLDIPMIPSYVYKDLETLDNEFDQIAGLNDVSQGVMPSASIPAQGMAILQEQDQTRISVSTKRNEVGYARLSQIILKYVSKNYVMERLLKLAGEGLGYTVKSFKGSDINDNTDVICLPGSTVPNSKVLKRQDILNTYQAGLLGDPNDPKLRAKVLSMIEFGDVSEMWKTQALDMAMVQKTIKAIENNDEPDNHEWDNHGLFVQEMNDYRKTDKYSALSPQQKDLFSLTVEWHIQALISLTQPEVPQQQNMAEHMMSSMKEMMPPEQPPMNEAV